MKEKLEAYLKSKELAWEASTLKNERARLGALIAAGVLDGNPDTLWAHIQTQKPYSRLTTWVVVTGFWEFAVGTTVYREWKRRNRLQFKHVYERRPAGIDRREARKRVARIADVQCRALAEFLLATGCRYREHATFKDGRVLGKGRKPREILATVKVAPNYTGTYLHFYRALKKVGLTPHELRKVHGAWLDTKGASPYQIARVLGHSDIKTTMSYVPGDRDGIKKIYSSK